MLRLETRGPESGICNICGKTSRLTDDHIPPKGVPLVGQSYLEKLSDSLGAERNRKAGRLFQRGVKYRSVCSNCNNALLGGSYDPTLIGLCKELHSVLPLQVHLPVPVTLKINRLVRAFVGHLLSHGIGQHRLGKLSSQLTDYFLDESLAFPKDLTAYCWIYPYKAQVVAHGLGSIFDFRSRSNPFVFSLIKFYPIGFMCSIAALPDKEAHFVTRVDHLTTGRIDDEHNLILNRSHIPSGRWPEAPGKNGAVFHNNMGTIATPTQT